MTLSTPRPRPLEPERVRVPAVDSELAALRASHPAGVRASVLLVPGFTGSKEDFLAILAPLAEAGYEVVTIDQRGQHESPWGEPESYDFDRLARDVIAVAQTLHGPVHLVGHSLGGLVARRAVLNDPTSFDTLTLMASGPAGLVGARRDELVRLLEDATSMSVEELYDAQQRRDRESGAPERPAPITAFLRARALASCPTGLQRMAEQLRDEPDLVDDLRGVSLRMLVLYGDADNAWPPALQERMAQRLGAQLTVIPGAAHSPAAEAPQPTVQALLAFWESPTS